MRLRFATFLAPSLEPLYRATVAHVGDQLGCETELVVGTSYDQFAACDIDAGFICGLPYVRLAGRVHALAAPVCSEPRYEDRPVYFSDVVVRSDHPARRFTDLRGATWCYNEPASHSGYMTVLHHLVRMGETPAFFDRFEASGFHVTSMRLVAEGAYDASAIDSHVLAIARRRDPGLVRELKVIDAIGPSTIQPVVCAGNVPPDVREAVADALTRMHHDDRGRRALADALVARYAPVSDADYDDIRAMAAAVEAAGFVAA
jgi:phosphonate transport system substrate-binding protein